MDLREVLSRIKQNIKSENNIVEDKEKNEDRNKNKNKRKTTENLIIYIVIIIITIVAINYIWSDKKVDNLNEKTTSEYNKSLAQITENNLSVEKNEDISKDLENILSNIKGVGKVKVLITYSQTSKTIPMYSEDFSEKVTEENDSGGGTRTINENVVKKDIVYEEENGVRKPITQSVILPQIEGAIITAQGAGDAVIKESIIQAVEAATGLSSHKIQVFEMDGSIEKY